MGDIGVDAGGILVRGGGQRQRFATCCLDDSRCAPTHSEIGLDGAQHARRGRDLPADTGILAARDQCGIDVGGRSADIEGQHILAPGLRKGLHAAKHGIRRRHRHEVREPRTAREAFPADDMAQEYRSDRLTRTCGGKVTDPRQDIVGGDDEAPLGAQNLGAFRCGLTIARKHNRSGEPGVGEANSVVPQDVRIAAVGSADEQDYIRTSSPQRADRLAIEGTVSHMHDASASAQTHPIARERGHRILIADNRQPQPTARAGAHEHGIAVLLPGLRGGRVQPLEHIGSGRGRDT